MRIFDHPWLAFFLLLLPATTVAAEDRWWPVQSLPKAIVCTEDWERFPSPNLAYRDDGPVGGRTGGKGRQ